jgi:hypothetical protein
MIIECTFTLSLAGGSAFQGRGGPSPRLRPRLSQRESVGFCPTRDVDSRSFTRETCTQPSYGISRNRPPWRFAICFMNWCELKVSTSLR